LCSKQEANLEGTYLTLINLVTLGIPPPHGFELEENTATASPSPTKDEFFGSTECLNALNAIPFLSEMSEALTQSAIKTIMHTGDYICRRGDVGDRMWILVSGSVEVIARADFNNTGKLIDKVVATIPAPGYFGEMALLDKAKGGVRGASIRAITNCTIYEVMADDFEKTVGKNDKTMGALVRTLRSVPFLSEMSQVVDDLARAAKQNKVDKGNFICVRGDSGDRMWLLVTGSVEVIARADWKGQGTMSDKVVATIHSPGYFGEMALLDKENNGTRNASIRALTECDIFEIFEDDFHRTVGKSDEARKQADLAVGHRKHATEILAAKSAPIKPYMIGTYSIDYIYKREYDELIQTQVITPDSIKEDDESICAKAKALTEKGMYREAAAFLALILEKNPKHVTALEQRCACHAAARNYSGGLKDAQTIVGISRKDPHAWLRLADSYYGNRQYGEAKKAYVMATKTIPEHWSMHSKTEFSRKASIQYDQCNFRHNSFLVSVNSKTKEQRCACRPSTALMARSKQPPGSRPSSVIFTIPGRRATETVPVGATKPKPVRSGRKSCLF